MKKLIAAIIFLGILFNVSAEAKTVYTRTALTGGGSTAVDGEDGANLAEGDLAIATVSGTIYFYYLSASSGATAATPTIISPATNAGTKRWLLQLTTGSLSAYTDVTALWSGTKSSSYCLSGNGTMQAIGGGSLTGVGSCTTGTCQTFLVTGPIPCPAKRERGISTNKRDEKYFIISAHSS